jgi:hypothetical protein
MVPNQMSQTRPLKGQSPTDPRQHSTPKTRARSIKELGSYSFKLRMISPGVAASAEPAAEPEPYT